jgi:hypothetical protein
MFQLSRLAASPLVAYIAEEDADMMQIILKPQ